MTTLTRPLSKGYVLIVCAIALALVGLSLVAPVTVMVALLAILAVAIVVARPQLGLALMIPALFFEADAYSLSLPFGRVRLYHLLILALFVRVLYDIVTGKKKWRKTMLDWPLVAYLAINWLTVFVAPDVTIALKIAGLITLLAALYWTVTQLVETRVNFLRQAELLLLSALGIALFGIFQVVAVWLATHTDVALWHGAVIHSDVLPYGRPYATFVEPDWFGVMMAAAFAGTTLVALSKAYKKIQLELLLVALVFLIATVLSSVRGGWLAAAIALPVMLMLNRFKLRLLDTTLLTRIAVSVLVIAALALAFTPTLRDALAERVVTLVSSNTLDVEPRFLIMQDGWELFTEHPYIGRGPGAYTTLGTIPFVRPMEALLYGIENFQTNAILTILIDTGLLGLAVVAVLAWRFVQTVWQRLVAVQKRVGEATCNEPEALAVLFGLVGAGFTLALAYQVSTGVWLGLTWYLIALIIAGSQIGRLRDKHHAS